MKLTSLLTNRLRNHFLTLNLNLYLLPRPLPRNFFSRVRRLVFCWRQKLSLQERIILRTGLYSETYRSVVGKFLGSYTSYAEQRLVCVNAEGAARLVLSFKNHIHRRGGTVARTARDLRLPQVPEAPVDTHRPREATLPLILPRPLLFLLAQILLLGPTRSWPTHD